MAMSNTEESATKRRSLADYVHLVAVPALVLTTALVVVDVGGRLCFGRGLLIAFPLETMLVVLTAFYSLAARWKEGTFIDIDILTSHLNKRMRAIVEVFGLLIGLGCSGLLIWRSTGMTILSFSDGSRPSMLNMPLWPWKAVIPLGTSVLCWEIIARLIRNIRVQLTTRRR